MPPLAEWIREVEAAAVEIDDSTPAASNQDSGRGRRRWVWAVVAAVCVVGCGVTAVVMLQRPAHTKAPSTAPSTFVTYTDTVGGYRISYPSTWQKTTDDQGDLLLHVGAHDAVSVHQFTLKAAVNVQNIADMRAVTDAILSAPGAHLTVLESQLVRIGALTGVYYLYYFPSGNERGVHAHYFLFDGKRMFTLVFQSLPETDFQGLAKTFDAVAESFATTSS